MAWYRTTVSISFVKMMKPTHRNTPECLGNCAWWSIMASPRPHRQPRLWDRQSPRSAKVILLILFSAGDAVVYTIRVRNAGEAPLQNLWLTDTIPQGVTLLHHQVGLLRRWCCQLGVLRSPTRRCFVSRFSPCVLPPPPQMERYSPIRRKWALLAGLAEGMKQSAICTETTSETTTVNQRQVLPPTPITCRLDEAGDSFGTATNLPLGTSGSTAAICPVNDEDWFKFPVGANATIDGLLSHLPADYAAELITTRWRPCRHLQQGGTGR